MQQHSHDAIITADAFRQAAYNLKQRGSFTGRYFNRPFTGKMFCGKCGFCVGFRHWDLGKENALDAWVCGACYRKDPTADHIMLKDAQIKKTFLIALDRLSRDYEWNLEDFQQEILCSTDCNRTAVQDAAKAIDPAIIRFNERVWHQLLDSAKVMPDRTIIYKFRNGKKETVSLTE